MAVGRPELPAEALLAHFVERYGRSRALTDDHPAVQAGEDQVDAHVRTHLLRAHGMDIEDQRIAMIVLRVMETLRHMASLKAQDPALVRMAKRRMDLIVASEDEQLHVLATIVSQVDVIEAMVRRLVRRGP